MISQLRSAIDQRKGQHRALLADIKYTEVEIARTSQEAVDAEQAQFIIQTVAKQTQAELEYHVSELGTLALAAIFENPYELKLEIVDIRNKTEADIYFLRGEDRLDPMFGSGGGPVNVASFGLLVAMWSLSRPRPRNVLAMDEPFRWLSRDLHGAASEMLKMVSMKLGLQMIMVTHSPDFISAADKVFTVTKVKRTSKVM